MHILANPVARRVLDQVFRPVRSGMASAPLVHGFRSPAANCTRGYSPAPLRGEIDPARKTLEGQAALQRQIDTTDRQIDQLVYELYDLTEEEMRIVEEATER